MTKIKSKLLVSTTVLASLVLYNQTINADTTQPNETPAIQATDTQQAAQAPKVVDVQVSGEPNTDTVGTEVFDPVTVTVKTDHFTNDNLLTKDGLGWTDETEVQPIKGTATGTINNPRYWGQNNPTEPVTAYTFNNGDSGRITNIVETLAGTKLDLIYTVEDSDKDDWMAYSGFGHDGRTKGLAFTGEQYIKGSSNNSIVALYNGANYIDIKYQIVRHDTFIEQPVLVSFITTDIDVGQGVATDLANLALIIPKETNLSIKDGVIYDGSHTGPYHYGADLNGANGLPYGGYLGVAYLSKFNYTFFAPAPANDDIYKFATGVRYDLFGSALQTKLVINRQTHLTVKYVDDEGKEIQPSTRVTGTNDFPQVPVAPTIKDYQLTDTKTNIISPDEEEIIYQYLPEYHLTVEYLDEQGNSLSSHQELTAVKGALVQLEAVPVEGYQLPTMQSVIVSQNDTIKFIYSKQQLQTRVEYVDEQGNALSEPQEITSSYGSRITLQPVQITGFNTPEAKTVEVTANQTIRLVYVRKTFPITVQYVDEEGNLLDENKQLSARYDTEITLQPSEITGYLTPVLQTVRVTGATTVKFVYTRQELPIQVEFVDQDGRSLQSPETITARYGEKLSLEPVVIDGYTAPAGQELTVEKAGKVTFVYHRINRLANATFNPQPPSRRSPVPVRVVRQATTRRSAPVVMRTQPMIVRNVVHPQAITRPVYRSAVQVQARPIVARPVPKLPTVNTRIYNPTKRVNKQVQKKKQTDWFEKNTGMNKRQQKVIFDVLKAIDKDGKRRGLNQRQRTLEQLYYIAGVNYSTSRPQKYTSNVSNYNYKRLKKMIGKNKADEFYRIVNSQSQMHKVDLSHLAITAASSMDPDKSVQNSHFIATFPDQIRERLLMMLTGKELTNEHGLPKNQEQWLFANGYYGDYIVDSKMSKEDKNADLDVYRITTSKKGLIKTLKDIYNSKTNKLNQLRNKQEKGMVERSKLNVITSRVIITTASIATAGLLAWRNWRTVKQGAKMAVQAIIHPAKTIRKVVQKARAGVAHVKRQAAKLYTATKRIITHPIRTGRQIYRKTVNAVKRVYQKYTPRPIKRFNSAVKRTVTKRYNSARKSVSRFVKNTRTRVKKFFRRKRR